MSVQQAKALIDYSALVANREVGLFVFGDGAQVTMANSSIARTQSASDGLVASGVLGMPNTTTFMRSSDVRGSSGVALFFDNSTAQVVDSVVADNQVALQAQNGSVIQSSEVYKFGLSLTGCPIWKLSENYTAFSLGVS
jgi:hypothetical protein